MLNPPFSAGGYTHNLCNALADAGCEVELYTGAHYLRASRSWQRTVYKPRIRFYRHTQLLSYTRGPTRLFWRALRFLGYLWSMTRVVVDARCFDVVHVQYLGVPAVGYWWLRAIARRTPVVYTVHNLYPHDRPRHGRVHRVFGRIYSSVHALIVHTDKTAEGLVNRFAVSRSRITKVLHGNLNHMSDQHGVPEPADIGLDTNGPPIVLMFGALRHHKGVDVLLRAAASLRQDGVDFRVLFAGAPDVDPKIYLDMARELELDDCVEFRMGYVEEEAVTTYYLAATVVALPYRAIDQSGAAISALSLGRALVTTRVAGLEEVIGESQAGLLVPVDDPQATAEAIKRLLTDEPFRRRCEANARRYADQALAWEPIARHTVEIYQRVSADRTLASNATISNS